MPINSVIEKNRTLNVPPVLRRIFSASFEVLCNALMPMLATIIAIIASDNRMLIAPTTINPTPGPLTWSSAAAEAGGPAGVKARGDIVGGGGGAVPWAAPRLANSRISAVGVHPAAPSAKTPGLA